VPAHSSTIIGDTIARILEYCGHDVERVNHVGDWGTQFGMLIAHLKDTFTDYATVMPAIADLSALYKVGRTPPPQCNHAGARAHALPHHLLDDRMCAYWVRGGTWARVAVQESKKRFDKEDGFKARAHKEVVALQAGDPTNVSLWKRICQISADMFGEVYGRLGIDPCVRGAGGGAQG
jgi:arginyl-tRNA synthetase